MDNSVNYKERLISWTLYFDKYLNNSSGDSDDECVSDTNFNQLRNIINKIEYNLHSNLKDILIERMSCKILESTDYDYWHNKAKVELTRLSKYVCTKEIDFYLKYWMVNVMDDLIHPLILKRLQESRLKSLLCERESLRTGTNDDLFISKCVAIKTEWTQLLETIPATTLIKYAISEIRNFIGNSVSSNSTDQLSY